SPVSGRGPAQVERKAHARLACGAHPLLKHRGDGSSDKPHQSLQQVPVPRQRVGAELAALAEQEPDLAQFSGMERCRLAHRRTSTGDWRVCAAPCLGGLNRTHVSRIIVAATAGRKHYRPRLVSPFWVGVPALAGSSRDSNPKVTHDPAAEVAACLAEWLD